MSLGPQFNDLMEKKYNILQQNADSEATKANAAAQNVAQQQALQQQSDAAAQARAQLNADTQLQSTSMNNQGANYRTGLTSGLENNYRMAGLGLDAAKYASDDEIKRLALTRPDDNGDGLKLNPTDSLIGSVARNVRMSGLQFPSSPIPQLPGYKDGGRPPVDRPVVVGEAGPETFVPDNGARPVAVGQSGPEVVTTPVRGTVLPNTQAVDADLQRRALNAVMNQPKPESDPLPPLTRNGGIEIWYSNPKQDQSPTLGQQRTRDLGSQFINNLHVMNDAERKDAWKNARPEDRFAAIEEYNRLKSAGENPVNPRQQANGDSTLPDTMRLINASNEVTPPASYRAGLEAIPTGENLDALEQRARKWAAARRLEGQESAQPFVLPEDSHGMQVMRDVRNRLNGLGDTLGVNRNWGQGLESLIYGETPEQRQARRRNGLGQ